MPLSSTLPAHSGSGPRAGGVFRCGRKRARAVPAFAMSTGRPIPRGRAALAMSLISATVMNCCSPCVRIQPGRIALTLIPWHASPLAMFCTIASAKIEHQLRRCMRTA